MSGAVLGVAGSIALAGTAVSAGVGGYEASVQSGIAGQQAKAANTQLGMEQTQFGEQQGFEQQLANLVANPGSVTNTPGYSFNFAQGANATAAQMTAGGFLNSGNEAAALTSYGQGMAMNTYNQQVQMLTQLAGFNATGFGSNSSNSAGVASSGANATFQNTGQLLASLGFMNGTGGFSFSGKQASPNYNFDGISNAPGDSGGIWSNPFGGN